MLHLQLYYSFRRFPSVIFSKSTKLNPLGRWTMKRRSALNTYLASLDHEDGTLNGVQYCRETSKKLVSYPERNYEEIDLFSEYVLSQDRL